MRVIISATILISVSIIQMQYKLYGQILSATAIILGVYIIVTFLLQPKHQFIRQNQYHLGCFLTEHNLSHSKLLAATLSDFALKSQSFSSYSTAATSVDYINTKGLQAARSFQSFIGDFNKQKNQMKSYVQLSKAVGKAFENYQNCTYLADLNPKFQQMKCKNTWIEYQNCSEKMTILKQRISYLLIEKANTESKIQQAFYKIDFNKHSPRNVSNQIEKEFKIKDKELELQEKTIETNIKTLGQKISSVEYSYSVAQNQTLHSRELYKECTQHQKQFRLCEELTRQVSTLGHGTLQSLSEKVEKKRVSIIKIQTMINSDQTKSDKLQLGSLQNRSLEQYKKLHKIFIETKAKLSKSCGCTAKEQQKLYETMHAHVIQEQTLKAELIILQQKETRQNQALSLIREKRRALLVEFQKKIKQKDNSKIISQEVSAIQQLKALEIHDLAVEEKTLSYQPAFLELQKQCKNLRLQLSAYLGRISQYSQCLVKKDYYQSLKSDLERQKQKLSLDFASKANLIKVLQQFVV